MKLDITIKSSDAEVISEIAKANFGEQIIIRRSLVTREIINPPVDFILLIGEGIDIQVASNLIAKLLWNKLKGRKDNKL